MHYIWLLPQVKSCQNNTLTSHELMLVYGLLIMSKLMTQWCINKSSNKKKTSCKSRLYSFTPPVQQTTIKVNYSPFIIYLHHLTYTILPKVLGHPLLMKGLTTLVISMSTNLNVQAYNYILRQWFSKYGTRTTSGTWDFSSGTQRNLRIKYKSGRVSTKAIFFLLF